MKFMKIIAVSIFASAVHPVFSQQTSLTVEHKPLYGTMATGTHTYITGRVYFIQDYKFVPVISKVKIKGTKLSVKTDTLGYFTLDITDLVKSKDKLVVVCDAKHYAVKDEVVSQPYISNRIVNFELTPKAKNKKG